MTPRSGRVIAWLSFTLGIVVSVLGNIAHATSDEWTAPEVIGSAFWPLALMLSIEVLTRTRWVEGKRWLIARFAGLIAVAVVAAVLSYRHLAGLMTSWGEDWLNAHLGPLAVDGLMLLAATALLSMSKADAMAREAARIAAEKAETRKAAPKPQKAAAKPVDLTPPPLPEAEPSGLHVVDSVPESVAEEAVRQAWLQSNRRMSSAEVGAMLGTSKATGHRRIQRWQGEMSYR